MAGECRLDGDIGGLQIAHLANHDDIGVLADNGSQDSGEVEANVRFGLDLGDPFNLIFNWVLNGDDFTLG